MVKLEGAKMTCAAKMFMRTSVERWMAYKESWDSCGAAAGYLLYGFENGRPVGLGETWKEAT